jgi:Family of unknown function (DUF5856)
MAQDSCPTFVAEAFALRTAIHFAHLSSKSYSEHVALGDFYDALLTLTDKYAEVFMGLEGQVPAAKWPAVMPPTGTPISMLEEFLEDIAEEEDEDSDRQSLLNILAEMEELTAQTLYKLRNLK